MSRAKKRGWFDPFKEPEKLQEQDLRRVPLEGLRTLLMNVQPVQRKKLRARILNLLDSNPGAAPAERAS